MNGDDIRRPEGPAAVARARHMGQRVRAWRDGEALTVREAAGRLGISRGFVQEIEDGLTDPHELPPALLLRLLGKTGYTLPLLCGTSAPAADDAPGAALLPPGASGSGGGADAASPPIEGGTARAWLAPDAHGNWRVWLVIQIPPDAAPGDFAVPLTGDAAAILSAELATYAELALAPGSIPHFTKRRG